ncbi:LamG domain-containing protein [Nocardioides sp.]|uniref:LamG domain-containing protein n=1 Tax=Nocardioides sp. TaxID=35761 RepID=UPI0019C0873A|nr:LamG domain-containing protein [Nocardioides sp.]MBC7276874.1 LamG domain-containing protein [Nocardioides sp.]
MRLSVLAVVSAALCGLGVSAHPASASAFNAAPSAPTEMSTSPETTCPGESYLRDTTPVLSATFADPDDHNVAARFEVLSGGSSVWSSGYDAAAASGSTHAVTVPEGTLTDGATYTWRARGRDTNNRPGPWAAPCEFTVDTVRPDAPVVTSTTYPEDQISGGVGTSGTFDFAGSSDTEAFRYSFDGTTPAVVEPSAIGASATATFTPSTSGSHRLSVEAIDRAGNVSDSRLYRFSVESVSTGAYWRMDTGASPELDSAPGGAHPLNVPEGVERTDGTFRAFFPDDFPGDLALGFDGDDSGATTQGAVLDASASFTMSAFVRVDDTSSVTRAAVSQGGEVNGAAQLGRLASGDCPEGMTTCFGFWMQSDDTTPRTAVTSARPVAVGEWVHLSGVWDASAKEMTLYTCAIGTPPDAFPADSGVPVATSAAFEPTGPSSAGPVRVGSGWVGGEESQKWHGAVDDVRLYSSVKSESDIRMICNGDTTY